VQSGEPYWEIVEMHSREWKYRRTTFESGDGACAIHEAEVRQKWQPGVRRTTNRTSARVNAFDKALLVVAQYARLTDESTENRVGAHHEGPSRISSTVQRRLRPRSTKREFAGGGTDQATRS